MYKHLYPDTGDKKIVDQGDEVLLLWEELILGNIF